MRKLRLREVICQCHSLKKVWNWHCRVCGLNHPFPRVSVKLSIFFCLPHHMSCWILAPQPEIEPGPPPPSSCSESLVPGLTRNSQMTNATKANGLFLRNFKKCCLISKAEDRQKQRLCGMQAQLTTRLRAAISKMMNCESTLQVSS